MHPLEHEIQSIMEQLELGNITKGEHDYLITEIEDVRAARECADNEILFRQIVSLCKIAKGLM